MNDINIGPHILKHIKRLYLALLKHDNGNKLPRTYILSSTNGKAYKS